MRNAIPTRCSMTLALLLTAAAVTKVHLPVVLDPWRVSGDACQHVFWTAKFADADLFPGDPLVDFISSPRFDPLGYQGVYWVGSHLLDLAQFTALLGAFLSLVTAWLAYRIALRHGGPPSGLLAIVLVFGLVMPLMRVALPRAFAPPILLLGLDALSRGCRRQFGASVLTAALLYPPMAVSLAAISPLWVLSGWRWDWGKFKACLIPIGVPALVGMVVMVASRAFIDQDLTGPLVSRAESLELAEFGPGGRNEFWKQDPVAFFLGDFGYSRSSCALLSSRMLLLSALTLGLMLIRRRRMAVPRFLWWTLLSSTALFSVAHLILFHLFLPNRYTFYSWPLALIILVSSNLGLLFQGAYDRHRLWLDRVLIGLLVVALPVVVGVVVAKGPDTPEPKLEGMYAAIANLPKDAVVAGWPTIMDEVPLRSLRSVLINRELSLAWYQHHRERVRARTHAALDIMLGGDEQVARDAQSSYGVTHMVVDEVLLALPPATLASVIDRPFDERVLKILGRGRRPWWRSHPLKILYEKDGLKLIEMP